MVPEKVKTPMVTAGDGSLMIDWEAPMSPADAPIIDYSVQYMLKGGAWADQMHEGIMTETTIDGLTNGSDYYVQVAAVNKNGPGDYSESAMGTPMMTEEPDPDPDPDPEPAALGKPAVEVMPGDGMATVSWIAIEGATKYMVQWKTAAQTYGFEDRQVVVTGSGRQQEIRNLKNGTVYMFRVLAGNAAGYGTPSDDAKTTPEEGPYISQPTHLKVEPGGVALLRRRPRELRRASRQELLDASKAWWGGWRGRLADRRRRPFSVSLGVIPLVFARFVEVPVRVEVAAGP